MESLALEMFQRGDDLKKICRFLDLPLFTIVCYLRKQNVKEAVLNSRMPPADDSLYIEFRKTVNRKSKLKYKPLSLH
ncbi:hypothetical protein DOX43_19170 [Cronobacter malonaticus]|nr:hypothetical protein [Cronobacter malonaticus]EGT4485736.1 hypothetical protein [Cronobacter malonaticus]